MDPPFDKHFCMSDAFLQSSDNHQCWYLCSAIKANSSVRPTSLKNQQISSFRQSSNNQKNGKSSKTKVVDPHQRPKFAHPIAKLTDWEAHVYHNLKWAKFWTSSSLKRSKVVRASVYWLITAMNIHSPRTFMDCQFIKVCRITLHKFTKHVSSKWWRNILCQTSQVTMSFYAEHHKQAPC